MPNYALAGGEEDIGGNKPADFGVIVPALEVVEARLLIRQSSDCRYRHTHGNGRDYSFRVWKRVSPRLTAVCPKNRTYILQRLLWTCTSNPQHNPCRDAA